MSEAIRNFSIIAHIDHGKTTLTDQLLKRTGTIPETEQGERILDSNPIEKERGITIKLAPVTMHYTLDAKPYTLNLIDTPGHVDFSYEVSRSLAACEGAILLVDATQGIQAQTLAHAHRARALGLVLLPVVNKIDRMAARIEETEEQLESMFGFTRSEIVRISAKTGEGIDRLLQETVSKLPPPRGNGNAPLRAQVFNSMFDQHLGIIAFVRVVDGTIEAEGRLRMLNAHQDIEVKEIGIFSPHRRPLQRLGAGAVGYISTGLKDVRMIRVGDTLTTVDNKPDARLPNPLPGLGMPTPMVFADYYPGEKTDFTKLQRAVEKLKLTDAALSASQVASPSLGSGIRLGFLGVFHCEITKERLKREFAVASIVTKPTVKYTVETNDGKTISVTNPTQFPQPSTIKRIYEPIVEVTLLSPKRYLGPLMKLLEKRRGEYRETHYVMETVQLVYHLPLSELIAGFADDVKSVSQGYATTQYRHIGTRPVDAVKLTLMVNHEPIGHAARIVVRAASQDLGRLMVERVKDIFPRQQFTVPIQAAIGGRVIAHETLPALRKDVTAKLYGGDRTRRMKLLQKQRKGKARLARLGKLSIPQDIAEKLAGI